MPRDSLFGSLWSAVRAKVFGAAVTAALPPAPPSNTVFIVFRHIGNSVYGEPVVAFTDFERAQTRRDALTKNGVRSEVIGISLEG